MQKSHYEDLYDNQDTLWWYKGMRLINTTLLNKYFSQKRGLKILDAGCGAGAALGYLSQYGETIGVDISDEALKFARKRGKVKKADIANLPFKDNSFDLVFCYGVLYHVWVKDERKALDEFYRVLKKGGTLLLEEPAYDWFMGNEDMISFGKHRFTASELKILLKECSFKTLRSTYINSILFPLGIVKRLPEIIGLRPRRPVSDIFEMSGIINFIFLKILQLESKLLKYINFPFGMSVICIARKNEEPKTAKK
ncbi:methyltransferase type 11 [Candidatus Roizmanbacteria bacterium CG22_combo_CG10-13_8_21_14_all_38_20]|uniref:Methyltransferase type 11 n=1 Tax=Candidatus Roizmanbacteria bacterium CG22_combo_CG10-13_8_21_14_all_38_20 TaxID=1974862 RepID=A0A2H0BW87_9BACT|nr:class I SAM-dependent methyltransferase [Candidatus Microgenomates bacterium]PIP61942.1 MAG: methyltransferase type 11 [Candidatus Roizmanbacteria bacterium CG22_combo_CG10-13_8_21_14_all_38_20]PJC32083.1 MAG: methyltransferase type 11 [Candidatus Roizmanbacteria bacterium CG_4_9_14_0_2_um_filter_38_17]